MEKYVSYSVSKDIPCINTRRRLTKRKQNGEIQLKTMRTGILFRSLFDNKLGQRDKASTLKIPGEKYPLEKNTRNTRGNVIRKK